MDIPRRRLLAVLPVLVGAVVWAGLAGTRAWAGCEVGCADKSNCGNVNFSTCTIPNCNLLTLVLENRGCCQPETDQGRIKRFYDCNDDRTADCEVWQCLLFGDPACTSSGNPGCF